MAKRNALGKGLSALIDVAEDEMLLHTPVQGSQEINIDCIEPNPFQPRTVFDDETLSELADSIRHLGIIQPVTVKAIGENRYQLISGERRIRAAKLSGLSSVPAFVRTSESDNNMLEMALVENIQRDDLNPIETAISFQRLIDECHLTQEELSTRIGKKRSTITNYLRLLKLPAEIQIGLQLRKLDMGHARALIGLENVDQQIEIFNRVITEQLSVRQTEELVREISGKREEQKDEKPEGKKKKPEENLTNDFAVMQHHLTSCFGTKVQFIRNNNGSGKIVIPFKGEDELERIIGLLDKINS